MVNNTGDSTPYLPTDKEIEALHRKHAPSQEIFDKVWSHSQIVARIAGDFAIRQTEADEKLVRVGALIHDIGVYPLLGKVDSYQGYGGVEYLRHGPLGETLLLEEGFDIAISRFASHHTGVGVTRLDVISKKIPIEPKDYLAETLEERIVMFADEFHGKKGPGHFKNIKERLNHYAFMGPMKVDAFNNLLAEFGEPDLSWVEAEH